MCIRDSPECRPEILDLADFIGSTSEIIDYASSADAKEFIIGTELGVLYELKKQNPDKIFYLAGSCLLYTSDAADDLLCVDLGGPRNIKKKKHNKKKKHTTARKSSSIPTKRTNTSK